VADGSGVSEASGERVGSGLSVWDFDGLGAVVVAVAEVAVVLGSADSVSLSELADPVWVATVTDAGAGVL
jgi:hypothetical protein